MDKYCKICKISKENDVGAVLFQAPNEEKKRKAWSKTCGVFLTRNCFVCQYHFDPNDVIGRRKGVRLKANAMPIHDDLNVNKELPDSAFFDVDIKVETNEIPEPLAFIHEARFDEENSNAGVKPTTKDTNLKSSEKRICGQVEVVDEKGHDVFKLKCNYCDVEYHISYYPYFIDHIKAQHGTTETLEVQFSKSPEPSLNENTEVNQDKHSAEKGTVLVLEEDSLAIKGDGERENFIENKENKDEVESSDDELHDEQSDSTSISTDNEYEPKCKKPNIEKQQRASNENIKRTKENLVFFDHPEEQCVLDYLELIKSNSILWHRRQSIMKRFDDAVEKITNEFNTNWPKYQMTHEQSRTSINRIKDLYQRVSDATHKRHIKNSTHLKKYPKYFKICSEIEEESKKVTNPCDNCKAFFFNEIDLQIHKVKRHRIGELPFKCARCKYGFSKAEKLAEHEQKHHRVKTFTCQLCNKGFFDEKKLHAHEAVHSNDHKPVCEVCGEMFKNYSKYRRHRLHHEPPKEKCEICGKLYYEKWNLSEHVKSHKNERQYQCDICHKSFNHRNDVTIHKRGVHNVKPQPQKYVWVNKNSFDYNNDVQDLF